MLWKDYPSIAAEVIVQDIERRKRRNTFWLSIARRSNYATRLSLSKCSEMPRFQLNRRSNP